MNLNYTEKPVALGEHRILPTTIDNARQVQYYRQHGEVWIRMNYEEDKYFKNVGEAEIRQFMANFPNWQLTTVRDKTLDWTLRGS